MSGTHIERCEIVGEVAGADFDDGDLDRFLKHFRDKCSLRTVVSLTTGEFTTGQIAEQLLEGNGINNLCSANTRVGQIALKINQQAENLGVPPMLIKGSNRLSPLSLNPKAAAAFMALRERILPVELGGDPRLFMTDESVQEYQKLIDDLSAEEHLAIERAAKFADLAKAATKLMGGRKKSNKKFSIRDIIEFGSYAETIEVIRAIPVDDDAERTIKIAKEDTVRVWGININATSINKLSEKLLGVGVISVTVYENKSTKYTIDTENIKRLKARITERFELNEVPKVVESDSEDFYRDVQPVNEYISLVSSTVPFPGLISLRSALLVYAALSSQPRHGNEMVNVRLAQLKEIYSMYLGKWGLIEQEAPSLLRRKHFASLIQRSAFRPQGGNCRGIDPELFYPERGESTREAKNVCAGCVARLACLEFAIEQREKQGIWGGMSERERRRIRRKRMEQAAKEKQKLAEDTISKASAGD